MSNSSGSWIALMIAALIVGGFIGGALFSKTNEVVVTKEVPKEVIKEVPGPVTTVEKEVAKDYRADAVKELLVEIEDNDSLQVCSGNTYDVDHITVSKLYDEYSVSFGKLKNQELTTEFKVKLKYTDTDAENTCYRTENVKVFNEKDEDAVVTI